MCNAYLIYEETITEKPPSDRRAVRTLENPFHDQNFKEQMQQSPEKYLNENPLLESAGHNGTLIVRLLTLQYRTSKEDRPGRIPVEGH